MQKTKRRSDIAAIFTCLLLIISLICYTWMMRTPSFLSLKAGKPFLNWIVQNSDLALAVLFLILTSVPFYLTFDKRKAQARDLVPVALMAAMCVVGRAAFSIVPLPNFKPVTAIVMITAIAFGAKAGYLTGALAALLSNFLFGQGPWTPWQMFSWGMIGLVTGLLYRIGVFGTVGQVQTDEHGKRKKPVRLCVFGFFCGIAYGWFMNLQYIFGYVDPINWKTIGLAYAQSLYFDISHGVCTALVLYLAAEPWTRKLMRIRRKFSLGER